MADLDGLHLVIVPAWWPSPEQPINGIFCEDYARAFAAAGAKVGVIFPDLVSVRYLGKGTTIPWLPRLTHETLTGDTAAENVPVIRIRGLHTAIRSPAIQMHRFRRWLRKGLKAYCSRYGSPDLLHAMCAIPAGWACTHIEDHLANRVVLTEHTGPFSLVMTPQAGESYVRAAMRKASTVVAVSEILRQDMISAGIQRDISLIANPVSAGFLPSKPPRILVDNAGRRVFHALFIGRLTELKGIRELLRVASTLAGDARFVIHWHFAGTGPLEQAIRRHFELAGQTDRVFLHGFCQKPDVIRLVRESHFLILPTHSDNFGLAVCEALCVGRPVVGTLGTGCEAIIGPEDGLLAAIGDASGLSDAVCNIVSDYDRWDWEAISERARKRFSIETIASKYAAVFRDVVK